MTALQGGRVGRAVAGVAYQTGRGVGRAMRLAREGACVARAAASLVSRAVFGTPAVDADGAAVPDAVAWPEPAGAFEGTEVTDVPVVYAPEGSRDA